jgi:PIN domain nuclease of toxin-antitoxin system
MSVWEIAMLVSRKRLELTVDLEVWLRQAESLPYLHFVPLDNGIAIRSVILADFPHPDPVDRIIAATALVLEMPLVTKDRKLRGYSPLRTIW